ncbi:MAG: M23 family metallopeptidase [Bacteroidales bacterium]
MLNYFDGVKVSNLRDQLILYHQKIDELENSIIARDNKMQSIMLVLSDDIDSTITSPDVLKNIKATYGINDSTTKVNENTPPMNIGRGIPDLHEVGGLDSLSAQYGRHTYLSNIVTSSNKVVPYMIPPVSGYVSAGFDPSREHYAIDVVAENGNVNVVSVADGTVINSDYTLQTGHVLYIQHQNNLISVYKHNKGALKKVGDKVKQGELIAILGNSGELTTGPHLHFELWLDGDPINPAHYLNFER